MLRRVLVGSVVAALVVLGGAPAPAQTAPTPPPAPPPPKAWIVVDADSGAVVAAGNEREALPAASVFKLFTALVTVEHLPPGTDVPISHRAESMPARKINVKAGQTWKAGDLLHALLLVSANDAAVALSERIAGSQPGFAALLATEAARLGLEDAPQLNDPAGLDDEFSYNGGNRISARDLAIVARAAMAHPEIMGIATLANYRFVGGDGLHHRLLNHNTFLRLYPGAIGMKTGYTRRAGRCFIGAARRDGRTMLAVVLGAPDPYASTARLLDQGFATPPAALVDADHLPEVVTRPAPTEPVAAGTAPSTVPAPPATVVAGASAPPSGGGPGVPGDALLALAGGLPAVALILRRHAVRRRRRRPRPPVVDPVVLDEGDHVRVVRR